MDWTSDHRDRSPQSLKGAAQAMLEAGDLRPQHEIERAYANFQERFGPDRLSRLRGEELLDTMHAHQTPDSLVYWLEFKNDDEFPRIFGSIAGGSALKFGLYKSRETGEWTTGHPHRQITISLGDAMELAERNRQQLLAGADILERFQPHLPDADHEYLDLQRRLLSVAPDVADTAWGHKYFSLYAPAKLDDFHSAEFQRFHLIRLRQPPPMMGEPDGQGRYVSAGRFVALAQQAQLPLNHLTSVLNRVNGRPYRYWRVGTNVDGQDVWPLMREHGFAAIGWNFLGDLHGIEHSRGGKALLAARLQTTGSTASVAGKKAGEILDFATQVKDGDVVVAAAGERILGVGRCMGRYRYDAALSADAPHHVPVRWYDVRSWRTSEPEALQTTFRSLKKPRLQLEIEEALQSAPDIVRAAARTQPFTVAPPLDARVRELKSILDRKGQAILYGPPGTGKTYWARRAATDLAASELFDKTADALTPKEWEAIFGPEGVVRTVTFHPGFGYEDFVEGYRPTLADDRLAFTLADGVFKAFCDQAAGRRTTHYLLIDEINRGDPARIFGELLTLLEMDKRDLHVTLPSGRRLRVPENVRIIGTMNTADRSVAILDAALRRRFGFIELLPDTSLLKGVVIGEQLPLAAWLDALNGRLLALLGRDARNLQIGHAFFMPSGQPVSAVEAFSAIIAEEVAPLLQEYCYEDHSILQGLIGGLVDMKHMRVRRDLFESPDELLAALLQPFPDLTASAAAVAHEAEALDDDAAEDGQT